MATRKSAPDASRLDCVIAEDRRARAAREKGYREQALKLYQNGQRFDVRETR